MHDEGFSTNASPNPSDFLPQEFPKAESFLNTARVDCKYKGINLLGNPQQMGLPPTLWRDNSEVHSTWFLRVSMTLVPMPTALVNLVVLLFPPLWFSFCFLSFPLFHFKFQNYQKKKKKVKLQLPVRKSFTQTLLQGKPKLRGYAFKVDINQVA